MHLPLLSLRSAVLVSVLVLSGCRTAAVRPIPDPLPETLEWARPEIQDKAHLGLEVRENDSGSLESLTFEPGVRVTSVAAGSPAAAAGFRVGDVLLAWEDVAVDDPSTLDKLLEDPLASAEGVTLRVRRGDSVFELRVVLQRQEAVAGGARLVWRKDPARSLAGWMAGQGGVLLVSSHPNGPFPRAGIPVGSLVTALDGEPVRSERALIRLLQARDPGSHVTVDFRSPAKAAPPQVDAAHTARVKLFSAPTRVTQAKMPILAGYESSADGTETRVYLLDLWFISLFKYRREGEERHWRFLRFFRFSSGVGVLAE